MNALQRTCKLKQYSLDEWATRSLILKTKEEIGTIKSFFGNKNISYVKKLYQASENGFSAAKFHEKCDDISDTITLCLTENDKKIGGYTPLKWSSHPNGVYVHDPSYTSFIFSLSNQHKFTL